MKSSNYTPIFLFLFFGLFSYGCSTAQVLTIHNNVIQLFNDCASEIKFDLVNDAGHKTNESIEKYDRALYRIGHEGVLIIIRPNENDPSHGDQYKVIEKRRYAFQCKEGTNEVVLVELNL